MRRLVMDVTERVVSSRDVPRVAVDARTVLMVAGDGPRLERVVCNLVQNALKYTPRASRIEVRVEQRDDYAHVSVIDAGPGLACVAASAASSWDTIRADLATVTSRCAASMRPRGTPTMWFMTM